MTALQGRGPFELSTFDTKNYETKKYVHSCRLRRAARQKIRNITKDIFDVVSFIFHTSHLWDNYELSSGEGDGLKRETRRQTVRLSDCQTVRLSEFGLNETKSV